MNALDQAIKIIESLNKRVKYLEEHLSVEKWDEYCEWWEREKNK